MIKVTDSKGNHHEYYMDDWLKTQLDKKLIPSLRKKDEDYVLVIDGGERTGKSTLAMQIGRYVDHDLNLSKIVFNPNEFKEAIVKAKKGEVIIFDEAYRGFSSTGVLSEVNRILKSLMMEMGQKNLCVIVVMPTFFLLDRYVALFRARGLIHTFRNKGRKGFWRFYNKRLKKFLYLKGKKDYGYHHIKTRRKGKFFGYCTVNEEAYRKKKNLALKEGFEKVKFSKYLVQRDCIIYGLYKEFGYTQQKIADFCERYGFKLTRANIQLILKKVQEKNY